ncbi:hypothetical protein ACLKA6_013666 [Drosophila palustris]
MAGGNQKQQQQQASNVGVGSGAGSVTHSPERLRGATQDLFELLERVQCSRLDDQRCVLPAYFSQRLLHATKCGPFETLMRAKLG